MPRQHFETVDEYISIFPQDVQKILQKIRQTIHQTVPQATEAISYQIPTFKIEGKYLVYFAGFKNHISIYPIPAGSKSFEKEIAPYKHGRGTLRFSLNKAIPYDLIKKVTLLHLKARQEKK